MEEKNELLKEIVASFSSRKKSIFVATFSVGILTALYLFFIAPPIFKATTTLIPKVEQNSLLGNLPSGISSLASGIGLQSGEELIYPDIVLSRRILEPLLTKKFLTNQSKDSMMLIELLDYEFDKEEENWYEETLQEALKEMQKSILEVSVDKRTSLVTISANIPYDSKIASDVTNYLAAQLGYYSREVKNTQANEQYIFLEKRNTEIENDLKISEEKLKRFEEHNRTILSSPTLLLEELRLKRAVELNQAVFIELRKQLEFVKLEIIKDTPILNVLDIAIAPAKKDKPKRIIITLIAMIFTFSSFVVFPLVRKKIQNLL